MSNYERDVQEFDRLLVKDRAYGRARNLLNLKAQVNRWYMGRSCFRIFGSRPTTETGLKIAEFAQQRGCSPTTVRDPLRVYRVLGAWFERQIEPVPFTIAKHTVQHTQDTADAERLMEVWRKRGEPDEAEWKNFLSGGTASKTAEPNRNLSRSNDESAVRVAFDQFEKHLDAALAGRFFANRFVPADRAKAVADKINKLNGKRRNLLDVANSKTKQPVRTGHAAPAAELLAACGA